MRGGSFDSPTSDPPSSHLGVPKDQIVVCRRPSDGDTDRASAARRRDTGGVLDCRSSPSSSSSPHRRTWSVIYLRPTTDVTDDQLADRCATRSMPNVRWICDAAVACDATGTLTSSADDAKDRPGLSVDPDTRTAAADGRRVAAARRRRTVERSQRVSRSDPDVLKLPTSSSASNCSSRPSSLDRSRPQRQRILPPSRETLLLPVNVILPTANR